MCLPGTIEAVRDTVERDGVPRLDRRTVLAGALGAAVAAAIPGTAFARTIPAKRTRDLTHVFTAGFPVYTFDPPSRRTLVTVEANGFYAQEWTFGEHSGTHMDAPGHFVAGGRLSPEITVPELIAPIVVIDVSARAARNPDTEVTVADLRRFEHRHGRIPRGALVAMNSGWDAKINDPAAYKGGSPTYHFPGWSKDATDWLLAHRNPAAIGVDTLSLDPGNSTTFAVHVSWLGHDKYGLENLRNLGAIPARGATAFVGLIPWEEGSGGPARVVAVW
ncbi:MAG: cyclase family protein [Actinobacteria bacterium]|nr:cyclase family protein [Actinomycetota bacterium]